MTNTPYVSNVLAWEDALKKQDRGNDHRREVD